MALEKKDNPEPEEIKLPKDYPTCRAYGSTRLIVGGLMEKEKAKGGVGKDVRPALVTVQSILMTPGHILLASPVVLAALDICADCGTIRCVRVELGIGLRSA